MLGDDASRIFTVEVEEGNNIYGLKVAIKRAAFDYIDATTLDLWSISIAVDDDLVES